MSTSPIDREPRPRIHAKPVGASWPVDPIVRRFQVPECVPQIGFFEALYARRSGRSSDAHEDGLGAILYHSMRLRERRNDGRFGTWESRSAPSAGGIHGLRILVVPGDEHSPAGLYDPEMHGLVGLTGDGPLRCSVRARLEALAHPAHGYFLQFVADWDLYASRYKDPRSLILRDAGALLSVMCLVSVAFALSCCPLGHLGQEIVRATGLANKYKGVGGLLI